MYENLDFDCPNDRHVYFDPLITSPPINHYSNSDQILDPSISSTTSSGSYCLYDEIETDFDDNSKLEDGSDTSCFSSNGSDQENKSYRRYTRLKWKKRRVKCPQSIIQQRQAANLRERKRMQSINDAFEGLRAHIPTLPYEKRLSKVDTLKMAIGYIDFLSELVKNDRNGTMKVNSATKNVQKEQSEKIIVRASHGASSIAHSLSWSREKDLFHNGNKMIAKIWTPEDPRNKNKFAFNDQDQQQRFL